jgi:hypothetical protein
MTDRKNCALAFYRAVELGVRRVSGGHGKIFFEKVTVSEWHARGSTDLLFHNMN